MVGDLRGNDLGHRVVDTGGATNMGDVVSLALIAAAFGLFGLLIRIFDKA